MICGPLLAALTLAGTGCQSQTRQTAELAKKLEAMDQRIATVESQLGETKKSISEVAASVQDVSAQVAAARHVSAKDTTGKVAAAKDASEKDATAKVVTAKEKTAEDKAKPAPSATDKQAKPVKTGEAPVITADSIKHDFGTTWIGDKLEHAFTLTNKGKTDLEIIKVKPSCGCTVAGTYPKKLKPGESGKFPFTLDSKKLRGKYTKSITITSNDPANPSFRLSLAGECKRYVDVSPSTTIPFGTILPTSKAVEKVVTLKSNVDEPLKLTLEPPKTKEFKFELREKEPGKVYELAVTPILPMKPGSARVTVKLNTNLEKEKTLSIVAYARVPKRIDVMPSRVSIFLPPASDDKTPPRRPMNRRLTLTNNGEKPIKILETTTDDPGLKVSFKETVEGKKYLVTVEVPADYKEKDGKHKLVIKTDDDEFASIEVPIDVRTRTTAAKRTPPKPRPRPALELKGKPVPEFKLAASNGKTLSSEELSGKITILNFFAPNCGFCKRQIPVVEKVRKTYESKGVRFVNISQTMRKTYTDIEVAATLMSLGAESELFTDPENTLGKPTFKVSGFPTMFIVGKTGKVEEVNIGFPRDGSFPGKLKAQLDGLLNGKPAVKKPESPADKPAAAKPAPQPAAGQATAAKTQP